MALASKVLGALAPYNIKQEGSNKYRLNSPFRVGSNSMSFTLTIESDDKGAWYDHRDERGGSLIELANHLGIQTERSVESTKRGYSGMAEYANAHGVPAEVLAAAGWKDCTKDGRKAIEFPTYTGTRWRFIDGNQPYYKSVNGYQKCWYGLRENTSAKLSVGQNLVICNGEVSTVVGHAYGLATACITSGESSIPPNLLDQLREFMKPFPQAGITIALDCDDKGRKTADKMFAQLKLAGFNVKVIDLGLSKGGDLADFLALYGFERDSEAVHAFNKLPEITPYEPQAKHVKWTILHASELDNLPPVKWLIRGKIPDNGLTIVYGASGSGKSFYTLDIALRVAQVHDVVYVAGEGEGGYNSRIKAWQRYNGLGVGRLYMCLGAVSLLDSNDLDEFIYRVESLVKRPRLIIVDTLARSLVGGDENSSRDMGIFISKCDELRARFGCGVVVVHHTNKSGIYERGSGALRGASDSMIKISDEDGLIKIECAKSKDSKPFDDEYLKPVAIDIDMFDDEGNAIMPLVLVPADPNEQGLDGLTKLQKLLLTTAHDLFPHGFSVTEICEVLGETSRRVIYKVLGALRKLGYIEQENRGEPFRVTPAGMNAIGADVSNMPNVSNVPEKNKNREGKHAGTTVILDTLDTSEQRTFDFDVPTVQKSSRKSKEIM